MSQESSEKAGLVRKRQGARRETRWAETLRAGSR